ncbi:MAG: cbb3-type cytochrome c oxidase subunit I, partial [Verrucomicrobiota bacterium]
MSTDLSQPPQPLGPGDRARIDASTGGAVLLFFGSAIFWLLFGSVLEVISAIKLVYPGVLDGIGFFTYGRTAQAATSVFAYGFATPAAIGMGIWLAARLGRATLSRHHMLVSAGIVWNLGILAGTCSILAGYSTSIPLLSFPAFVTPFLFIAYALIAVWALLLFNEREPGPLFVSQWFAFAAFLAFPWLFAAANALLVWNPVAAPAQPAIALWFSTGFFNLWLVPMGLAAAFYIIPKATGLPLNSHHLSLLGFWTLFLFGAWTAGSWIIGGPVPAWISSIGVASAIMLLIPGAALVLNLHLTLRGHYAPIAWSPALRFVVTGIGCLAAWWALSAINSIPGVNAATQFSDISRSLHYLGFYGFFAMTAFGAIYYIVPRLTGNEWPCAKSISRHFWLAAIGIGFIAIGLLLGGLIQGFALTSPIVTFRSSMEFVWPFRFLAAFGSLLTLAAAAQFLILFAGILLETRKNQTPALLAGREE